MVNPDKLPARVNMKIFDVLQTRVAPNIFTPLAVYDGRKNAFSLTKLSLGPTDSAKVNIAHMSVVTYVYSSTYFPLFSST